jgi:hypothetical protein
VIGNFVAYYMLLLVGVRREKWREHCFRFSEVMRVNEIGLVACLGSG